MIILQLHFWLGAIPPCPCLCDTIVRLPTQRGQVLKEAMNIVLYIFCYKETPYKTTEERSFHMLYYKETHQYAWSATNQEETITKKRYSMI